MKKFILCIAIVLILGACARNREAETNMTNNAHNFIEQLFGIGRQESK